MKEELKISKELKEGLRSNLEKDAPSLILQNVLSRVKPKQAPGYVPDLQMPFILTLGLICFVGYFFYSGSSGAEQSTMELISKLNGLLVSNVFWWSLMAVSSVLLVDIFNQGRKIKRNKILS